MLSVLICRTVHAPFFGLLRLSKEEFSDNEFHLRSASFAEISFVLFIEHFIHYIIYRQRLPFYFGQYHTVVVHVRQNSRQRSVHTTQFMVTHLP